MGSGCYPEARPHCRSTLSSLTGWRRGRCRVSGPLHTCRPATLKAAGHSYHCSRHKGSTQADPPGHSCTRKYPALTPVHMSPLCDICHHFLPECYSLCVPTALCTSLFSSLSYWVSFHIYSTPSSRLHAQPYQAAGFMRSPQDRAIPSQLLRSLRAEKL